MLCNNVFFYKKMTKLCDFWVADLGGFWADLGGVGRSWAELGGFLFKSVPIRQNPQ
jgi:hypothetical protein